MATIVNGTIELVPALNGTLINYLDCTPSICSLDYAYLRYIPSFAANLAYLIIFAVFLVAQLIQVPFFRTYGFSFGVSFGLILEIIGYGGRIGLNSNVFSFSSFVIYLVCLTIAPAFISAAIYLCLSHLVVVHGPEIARLSPKTYTITFICCDVISLILQAAGGGIAASATGGSALEQQGVDIMVAGLAFQVFSLFLFMVLGLDFAIAVARQHKRQGSSAGNPEFSAMRSQLPFRLFPYGLALATITIFIRCCFRVAELKDGFGSSIANNQSLFEGLEGPMIMIAALMLTVLHPGFCFGGKEAWRASSWKPQNPRARRSAKNDASSNEEGLPEVTTANSRRAKKSMSSRGRGSW